VAARCGHDEAIFGQLLASNLAISERRGRCSTIEHLPDERKLGACPPRVVSDIAGGSGMSAFPQEEIEKFFGRYLPHLVAVASNAPAPATPVTVTAESILGS
jgi:hypothetical protein